MKFRMYPALLGPAKAGYFLLTTDVEHKEVTQPKLNAHAIACTKISIALSVLLSHIFRKYHDGLSFYFTFNLFCIVFYCPDIFYHCSHFCIQG
jgi:hypothetical protein